MFTNKAHQAGLARQKWTAASPGGGSGFVPSAWGTVGALLNADTAAGSDGDPVVSCGDFSSGGLSPILRVATLNGKKVLEFAADSIRYMNIPGGLDLAAASSWAVLAVARMNGPIRQRLIAGDYGGNWLLGWWNGAMDQAYPNTVLRLTGSPAADTSWQVYGVHGSGAGTIFASRANGVIASSGSYMGGPTGLRVGAGGSGAGGPPTGEPSDCQVAYTVVYSAFSGILTAAVDTLAAEFAL